MRYVMYPLLGLLMLSAVALVNGQPAAQPAKWDLQNAVLNTVYEAWEMTGKNDQAFADLVHNMAALSATNRGLALPDEEKVGQAVGQIVCRELQTDPDRLLYDIVDHAVMTGVTSLVPTAMSTSVPEAEADTSWTVSDAVVSTVSQAWQMSGQSRPEFGKMVNKLLALDLQNRDMKLPNTKQAGMLFGALLRADVEAHPNDLLYSAVDRALLQTMALSRK